LEWSVAEPPLFCAKRYMSRPVSNASSARVWSMIVVPLTDIE
jgi:hypothetical protein